ncbi:site-specific integrase [Parachryseolinea silvisoli]|uniref:site-specific integrase n=1 Tax=Parachryseolinea silvisoli TaxID=2873601 RepID=UPI002265DA3E|nr:site-specific integrase [Parachryseolinea silvisoli]MCD9015192.1 site-specific integrase [Parachryseolinea silvisoli]
MSSSNLLRIRFIIKKDKAKNDSAPVYARLTVGAESVDISLRRDFDIQKWDPQTGRAKTTRDEGRAFNNFLDQVRAELTNHYNELKYQKKEISAKAVRDAFYGVVQKERTLRELVDYHNNHLKHTLEWGTMKNYMTTQKYLEMFVAQNFKATDVPLSRLSYTFLVDFEIFLLAHRPKDHHKPCKHNTVLKHIERLRKMVNVAIKNEWLERDPFAKFQGKFIRKDRQFLNEEEIDALEQKEFPIERLAWARDLFVFSIYTGLAYCDVMSLTSQNITRGIDGEYWIITERKKTHQSVRFPILPKALEIIQKYKDDPRAATTGTIFARLSNQKLNAYLKEIATICGIDKHLTFHLARHTFATTIALCNGVPIETVSKILGHTSIRTTQIYAKVVEKKVSQDMSALRTKLASSKGVKEFRTAAN